MITGTSLSPLKEVISDGVLCVGEGKEKSLETEKETESLVC